MDPTISVSKGCFVFKNGQVHAKSQFETSREKNQRWSKTLLRKETTNLFYLVYSEAWTSIKKDIEKQQKVSCAKTLEKLVEFVKHFSSSRNDETDVLPTAALLTGINQPDHYDQFETLSQQIRMKTSASVCILQSRDCPNLKTAIETMVHNFSNEFHENKGNPDKVRLRRYECTMKRLSTWYHNTTVNKEALVVILPDFECFNSQVLQDFILILHVHCTNLPIMLVLGLATSISIIHSTLPYHVTSKIKVKIFETQTAPTAMNEILENVLLSPKYAFHLSGKAVQFLVNIFLYYDFSLNGLINGFKYCLMEHFFKSNTYALCSSYSNSIKVIKNLSHSDLEYIRRLLSFRPYVESIKDGKRVAALLIDDLYLRKKLPKLLHDCHIYFMNFRICIEFLTAMVHDLPKSPLGKLLREVYAICMSKDLLEQQEFRESWQMVSFLSKSELVSKISKATSTTNKFIKEEIIALELGAECNAQFEKIFNELSILLKNVSEAGMDVTLQQKPTNATSEQMKQLSRQELKEKLLQMSKQEIPISQFTKNVHFMLHFIRDEVFAKFLVPLSRAPALHELFVFGDVGAVRRNVVGAPRAAIHTALTNPYFYLQCDCCELKSCCQILPTLPHLSVAYKLHLECGRMINLFDWLQAFRSVVNYSDEEQDQIDPKIQASFTRAVAELQFLGYIKSSKRKTDHVTRLTW